ncbi:23S rRNA (uracil(1939)-C(5))-methyltransferase RlmD [bacterium]|nr:23S rRNA (uracil(1939)-C(5))-methyltransferase RlmD [bacterium]
MELNPAISHSEETVTIESLAYGGDAVCHADGRVVFVPDGVPGDVARIEILQDKGSFMRGELRELVTPSPDRVEPFCPYASQCGGCQWQTVDYPAQVTWKRTIVSETLKRIGGIELPEVEPCHASPNDRNYRTVARYPVERTSQGLVFGYNERRSHRIVDILSCPVAEDRVNDIAVALRSLLTERFQRTDIRELTIRAAHNHPSSLVSMVFGSEAGCSGLAETMLTEIENLAGVSLWITGGENTLRHLKTYGDRHRYETVNGKLFRIEERSFFQINIPQTESLVNIVTEMTGVHSRQKLVDGYGGVGLFSLGVPPTDTDIFLFDVSGTAVRDSIYNARNGGFSRFRAVKGTAQEVIDSLKGTDVLFIDPPRTGLGLKAVRAVCSPGASTIVYISCNPATLARDLKIFAENGYSVERIVPVDMFPHTFHIETVVKLERD